MKLWSPRCLAGQFNGLGLFSNQLARVDVFKMIMNSGTVLITTFLYYYPYWSKQYKSKTWEVHYIPILLGLKILNEWMGRCIWEISLSSSRRASEYKYNSREAMPWFLVCSFTFSVQPPWWKFFQACQKNCICQSVAMWYNLYPLIHRFPLFHIKTWWKWSTGEGWPTSKYTKKPSNIKKNLNQMQN